MPNEYFQFKQFLVRQDKTVFKVGTDGVLLGSWADVSNVNSVLDIGTGTGLLALMIAQRCNASVTGIEIEESHKLIAEVLDPLGGDRAAFHQAVDNARRSPWSDRVEIKHISLQDFVKTGRPRVELIISNPPYFINSLKSGDDSRNIARHAIKLSFRDLIEGVNGLLALQGRFCLILPAGMVRDFIADCLSSGLYLHRELAVKPTESLPAKRHLLDFRKNSATRIDKKEIAIERSRRHDYTDGYRELTRDFYLSF